MTWTLHRQQQQCGAQLHNKPRPSGEAPAEAVGGREAQDHDYADLDLAADGEPRRGIDYPATNPPDRKGDITPSAADPRVEWDDVVQPEDHRRRAEGSDQPPGEGK